MPHILAREAFAILQEAGCAEVLALGSRGSQGVRLAASDGWTEAEALAALRAADQDELILFGEHRDETWEILARPRPGRDHRCTLAAIRKLVATARALDRYRRDEKQRAALWPAEALEGDAESLWVSEQSIELVTLARRLASSHLPILITGETGTGKEMLARVIHRASDRAGRPLVPFNCTAVPREMLESQLFGYRRGAFTGADTSFAGVIRSANGGTLFLDEIGDIGLDVQPKLLRFIEQREVHPLGEPQPVKVDVRIIAATNANLEQLVAEGRFREDLFYRLKVLPLPLAAAARTPRGNPGAPPALPAEVRRRAAQGTRHAQRRNARVPAPLRLAGEHPAARQRGATDDRARRARCDGHAGRCCRPRYAPRGARSRLPTRPPNPRFASASTSPCRPPSTRSNRPSSATRWNGRTGRVEEAARILGISRKGLFLKRRRWGLRQAS